MPSATHNLNPLCSIFYFFALCCTCSVPCTQVADENGLELSDELNDIGVGKKELKENKVKEKESDLEARLNQLMNS